jgi:hypothetical protein
MLLTPVEFLAEVSKKNIFSFSAKIFPSLVETCLVKSILLPHKTKIDSSVLTCLIKFIQVITLVKEFLFETSYKIKIMEAPRTYEGINALYLSCPAESQI